jgi:NAD(P)-dependent dehydrogenase (short-subunit alcohol dehydrogenase family)
MTESPIAGKVALVTASSRFTGAHIAAALARAGAKTAVHYNGSKDEADKLVAQLRADGCDAAAFRADGGIAADLRQMADAITARWGGVDILVNNLGPYADTPFLQLPEAQWDWIMNTNLKAVYVLAGALAPGMIARGWGRIINISAASAFIRSHSVFGLAKAAVIHLTEALAVELAPSVTVNAIAPGQIEDSELVNEIDPNYKRILRDESPLKQLVTRQQIAGLVLALCGETFATTTGHTFRMDAGWTIPTWQYQIGAVEYKEDAHGDDVSH